MERTLETKEKDCESVHSLPPIYEAVHSGLSEDTIYPPGFVVSEHKEEEKYVPSFIQLFRQNIPWFSLLVIEVIIAWYLSKEHWPPSDYRSSYAVSCGLLFAIVCAVIGNFTSRLNRIFFVATAKYYFKSPYELGCIPKLQRFLGWGLLGISFTALVPGILIYSFLVVPYHQIWVPIAKHETCWAMDTIVVRVNTGSQAIEYDSRSNNATMSTHFRNRDLELGLNLLPTINASEVSTNDFELVFSPDLTSPDLKTRLRNDYVSIQLAEKTYEWGYTEDKLERKKGNFTEGPSGPSFPYLDMPLFINPKIKWTWSSGRVPSAEWMDDSGYAKLKISGYRPSMMPCNELRICTTLSITDTIFRPKDMEAFMVVLARIMIEMVKYGAANC